MDKFQPLSKACYKYHNSCIMLFKETWLMAEIPDPMVEIAQTELKCQGKAEGTGSACMSMTSGVGSIEFGKWSAIRTLNCCVSA